MQATCCECQSYDCSGDKSRGLIEHNCTSEELSSVCHIDVVEQIAELLGSLMFKWLQDRVHTLVQVSSLRIASAKCEATLGKGSARDL